MSGIYKEYSGPVALGGETAGGIVFALIFLFLFLSRKKESRVNFYKWFYCSFLLLNSS